MLLCIKLMNRNILGNNLIREWWRLQKLHHQEFQQPTRFLGMYRIFVQEIPNESCYDYLAALGVEYNVASEILLTKEQSEGYTDFQKMIMES